MGWDAFAQIEGQGVITVIDESPTLATQFASVARRCRDQAGGVDPFLPSGCLDWSRSGEMLEQATGLSCNDENHPLWSVEQVHAAYLNANWDFPVAEDDWIAYCSARYFLEVCHENNLAIYFSA